MFQRYNHLVTSMKYVDAILCHQNTTSKEVDHHLKRIQRITSRKLEPRTKGLGTNVTKYTINC